MEYEKVEEELTSQKTKQMVMDEDDGDDGDGDDDDGVGNRDNDKNWDKCNNEKHNNAMMISWTTAEDVAFEFTTRLRMTKMELKMTSMKMTTTMLGMMSVNYYL